MIQAHYLTRSKVILTSQKVEGDATWEWEAIFFIFVLLEREELRPVD